MAIILFSLFLFHPLPAESQAKSPNILFISVDDLNDWIGVLGGHPQAKTPNIDALAKRGMLFTNAQSQSPVCNPSRLSLMSSRYPHSTGAYFIQPGPDGVPQIDKQKLLPWRFLEKGYDVSGSGKLFHGKQSSEFWPNWAGDFDQTGPHLDPPINKSDGNAQWVWGALPGGDEQMGDNTVAEWAVKAIQKQYSKPFLIGVGFYRPHVPLYAPKKYFDMYPLDELKIPTVIEGDLDDLSEYAISLTRDNHPDPTQAWMLKNEKWKPNVQAYLACITFVDTMVGKTLNALNNSPYKDNTYVVLWSDHGMHMGEKEKYGKRSLWEDGARVPLIIAGPDVVTGVTNKPVQLMDVYPTLLELTGQSPAPEHEGHSLVPLLKNPNANWPHKAITSYGPGNTAIISENYRYIHYNNGAEEFYDSRKDPHEWNNLIQDPEYAEKIQEHRQSLPTKYHVLLGSGGVDHRAFEAAESKPDPKPYKGCLDPTQLGYNPGAGISDPSMCRGVVVNNILQSENKGVFLDFSETGVVLSSNTTPFFIPLMRNDIQEINVFSLSGKIIVTGKFTGITAVWSRGSQLPAGTYLLEVTGVSQSIKYRMVLF